MGKKGKKKTPAKKKPVRKLTDAQMQVKAVKKAQAEVDFAKNVLESAQSTVKVKKELLKDAEDYRDKCIHEDLPLFDNK